MQTLIRPRHVVHLQGTLQGELKEEAGQSGRGGREKADRAGRGEAHLSDDLIHRAVGDHNHAGRIVRHCEIG